MCLNILLFTETMRKPLFMITARQIWRKTVRFIYFFFLIFPRLSVTRPGIFDGTRRKPEQSSVEDCSLTRQREFSKPDPKMPIPNSNRAVPPRLGRHAHFDGKLLNTYWILYFQANGERLQSLTSIEAENTSTFFECREFRLWNSRRIGRGTLFFSSFLL